MDVRMPGLDGMKTAQLIRQSEKLKSIPIIFLSAFPADTAELMRGYAHGAVDFLLKPIEPEILRGKVRIFVDLFLQSRQLVHQAELLRRSEREALERKNELRFRSLTDAMATLLCLLSRNGKSIYANKALIDFTGLTPHERLNPYWRAVHPEDMPRLGRLWVSARRQGVTFESQFRLRRADGQYRWLLARAVAEREEGGKIANWIVSAVDITAEREAREQAETANRLKDEFLATVSHELRNPLNTIMGWTHLLRIGNVEPERAARALETIERNVRLQSALINDILDVSRIVRGKLQLEMEPMELSPVVEAALRAARLSAEEKRIEIAARLAASADAVSGDSERLQQVVNNLLSNAIKFTAEGGRITVKLVNLGSWLELSVADTGKGIRRDFLPFVFEPFRQAETHAAKAYGGLGLGLAIVRQLVHAHGGTVTAESDGEGLGATFRVRLPVCVLTPDASSADGAQSDDGAEPLLAGRKILVVDDDPDACELVREVLMRAGAQAIVAKSADEALMAFRRSRPDAILSDIGMPYFDGYQLIAKIRSFPVADGGGVPAIALTALGGEGVGTNILGAGFQAHIPKPVEPQLLIRLINELLPPEAKREW
jgi:hypothetical protein